MINLESCQHRAKSHGSRVNRRRSNLSNGANVLPFRLATSRGIMDWHRYGYWSSVRCQCDLDCCPLLLIDGHCSPTATAVLVPATIFLALPTLHRALRRIFPKGSTCLATRSCRMDHVPLQLFVILLQESPSPTVDCFDEDLGDLGLLDLQGF